MAALDGITECLVGLIDAGKHFIGFFGVVPVFVGMPLHGELVVCLADRLVVCILRYPKDRVGIVCKHCSHRKIEG